MLMEMDRMRINVGKRSWAEGELSAVSPMPDE